MVRMETFSVYGHISRRDLLDRARALSTDGVISSDPVVWDENTKQYKAVVEFDARSLVEAAAEGFYPV